MLIVCPNCATSYGVEMASLRPATGWIRQVRCCRCGWLWQAELSYADKLLVAADAVLPVRRAMLAAALAAADAAQSTAPRLRHATTVLADELEACLPAPRASISPVGFYAGPVGTELARAAATPLIEGLSAITARVVGDVRRNPWWQSWWLAWRASWWPSWCPSLSCLQCIILWLALADAAIIGVRADVVWAMPQTASFYAALGLPVNLRGIQFEHLTAAAERHDGELVLIVKGKIANSTRKAEDVPHLRFAILNSERQEIYSWTTAPARGRRLPVGETLAFQSELVLPPPDTREVMVRFIDRDNTF